VSSGGASRVSPDFSPFLDGFAAHHGSFKIPPLIKSPSLGRLAFFYSRKGSPRLGCSDPFLFLHAFFTRSPSLRCCTLNLAEFSPLSLSILFSPRSGASLLPPSLDSRVAKRAGSEQFFWHLLRNDYITFESAFYNPAMRHAPSTPPCPLSIAASQAPRFVLLVFNEPLFHLSLSTSAHVQAIFFLSTWMSAFLTVTVLLITGSPPRRRGFSSGMDQSSLFFGRISLRAFSPPPMVLTEMSFAGP